MTRTVHVRAFLLADAGVVPQLAMAVPSPPTGHTGAREWPVKPRKPPPDTIPHVPSGKGANSSQAHPGKGQIVFSVSASTVREVKKATKPHTPSATPAI